MEKLQMIYEGKAKRVFKTDDPALFVVEYKDDATAFNGEKHDVIQSKGILNNKISTIFFDLLKSHGIPTHHVETLNDREQLVKSLHIIPVEVVVRNIVAGSLAKRIGRPEGEHLEKTVLEFYYKDDALGDPMINDFHIAAMNLATPEQVETLKDLSLKINAILRDYLAGKNLDLVDFKLEFGVHGDEVLLGDEISPDTCRFWDIETKEKLDKDRFRRDLGGVVDAYEEVLRRLQA